MTVYDSDHYITGLAYKFTACTAAGLDGIHAQKGEKMRDGKNKIMIALHEGQISEQQLLLETMTADVMCTALLCKCAFFTGNAWGGRKK